MKKEWVNVIHEVKVEYDEKLLEIVSNPDWKAYFYDDLDDPDKLVEFLAYNLYDGTKLSRLDGFADLDDSLVRITLSDKYAEID